METAATSVPPEAARPDSTFRWLPTGEEALKAMLAAIDHARQSVRLETYIYQPDATGLQFRDALVRACQRGVKVQVLLDAFGSLNLASSFWNPLVNAQGEFAWFNPLHLQRWS